MNDPIRVDFNGQPLEFPAGTDPAVIQATVKKLAQSKPAEATLPEKIAGSAPVRFAIGAAEPVLGAVQMVANATHPSIGNAVNDHLARLEGMINRGRGTEDFDFARLGGNVFSPVNAGMSKVLPAAKTTMGRIGTGIAAGGIGSGLTPVNDGGDFWEKKAVQAGTGMLTGGVLTPVMGKVVDSLAPKVNALVNKLSTSRQEIAGARASLMTDELITKAMAEIGASADDLGKQQFYALRGQVVDALKKGKQIDPAALLRQQDFKTLGMPYTQGQITRDPTQFARERNLRGVAGVGEPLMNVFEGQNQKTQQMISALRGNPSEAYPAGRNLLDTLSATDKEMSGKVSAAYKAARESAGKDMELPLGGLANDFAGVLDRFGDKVPSGVKNQFGKFVGGENQTRVFTVEDADKLIKNINDHVGADKATNTALGELRAAVKRAVTQDAGVDDVFAPARKAAAERFKMHEAIPALEAAANNTTAPDDFVRRFVINGKTEEVQRLAKLLQSTNPQAYQEARAQVGAQITRAAFGENVTGDKLAAPERLAKALRDIGTDKLKAFYSQGEIDQLKRLSRVSAYINQAPSASAVNTSNNIQAMTSILAKIPGVPNGIALVNALKNSAGNELAVNRALNQTVPTKAAELTPAQRKAISQALLMGVGGLGAAGAVR